MTETDGRYVCPYCGSTYVQVRNETLVCTQCRKTIQIGDKMSINSGKWIKKDRKVVKPEHETPDTEKAVDNRKEIRIREVPEVKQ